MNAQRLSGIVLLVIGAIAVIIGINASQSVADQVSSTFAGRLTQATTWYLLGGIAAALTGLLLALFAPRGRPA